MRVLKLTGRLVALLLAVSMLWLAGCSDDEDSATDGSDVEASDERTDDQTDDSDGQTAEEFLAEADEICAEGNERVAALEEEIFADAEAEPTDEELSEFYEGVKADIRDQIDEIEAMDVPEEIAEEFQAFLDQANEDWAAFDEAGAEVFTSGEDPFDETAAMAVEIGVPSCAGDDEEEEEFEPFEEEAAEGATTIDVTATEYAFTLSSSTVAAGPVAFLVENAGVEEHELGWARLADGQTLEEVLAFEGDAEAEGLITDLGSNCCLEGGASGVSNVDLTPGTWAIVCFLPSPDGTPHAFLGMTTTLEVTG